MQFNNGGDHALFAKRMADTCSKSKMAENAVIRPGMSEGSDFYTISSGQWQLLSSWYGGGPEIKRSVREGARGHKFLEIYPRMLWTTREEDEAKYPLLISRSTTLSELRREAADLCRPEQPYELWLGSDTGGRHLLLCKEDDERTLDECDVTDFSVFCFESGAGTSAGGPLPIILGNGVPEGGSKQRRQGINGGYGFAGLEDEAGAKEEEETPAEMVRASPPSPPHRPIRSASYFFAQIGGPGPRDGPTRAEMAGWKRRPAVLGAGPFLQGNLVTRPRLGRHPGTASWGCRTSATRAS